MSHSAGPATPRGLAAELRDAVTPRTTLLVIGALALQLLFIASYVGALHDPRPHHVPFGVAVPGAAGQSEELAARLDGLDGAPLDARTVADEAEARHQIMERKIDGALVVDPRGTTDRLLVASGGGTVLATSLEQIITRADAAEDRQVRTVDVAPPTTTTSTACPRSTWSSAGASAATSPPPCWRSAPTSARPTGGAR